MKRKLFIYDFDGTITRSDSLFHFLNFALGPLEKLWILIVFSPFYFLSKFGLMSASFAKERLMQIAFGRLHIEQFNTLSSEFALRRLYKLVYPSFLEHLSAEAAAHRKVVVSASISNYLVPWAEQYGLEVLCTELEIKEGRVTGRFAKPNCNGPEKVNRINQEIELAEYDEIHVFGNSSGDQPMLQLGTHSYYRYFK